MHYLCEQIQFSLSAVLPRCRNHSSGLSKGTNKHVSYRKKLNKSSLILLINPLKSVKRTSWIITVLERWRHSEMIPLICKHAGILFCQKEKSTNHLSAERSLWQNWVVWVNSPVTQAFHSFPEAADQTTFLKISNEIWTSYGWKLQQLNNPVLSEKQVGWAITDHIMLEYEYHINSTTAMQSAFKMA